MFDTRAASPNNKFICSGLNLYYYRAFIKVFFETVLSVWRESNCFISFLEFL